MFLVFPAVVFFENFTYHILPNHLVINHATPSSSIAFSSPTMTFTKPNLLYSTARRVLVLLFCPSSNLSSICHTSKIIPLRYSLSLSLAQKHFRLWSIDLCSCCVCLALPFFLSLPLRPSVQEAPKVCPDIILLPLLLACFAIINWFIGSFPATE